MKIRWTVIALTLGALTLGLVAPTASTAAPVRERGTATAAARPDGEAMLYIAGGRSHASKIGKKTYRITLSKWAMIDWLGEVNGVSTVGHFKPSELVDNWARMGYGTGKGALAGVLWGKGTKHPERRRLVMYLSNPTMARDGSLRFTATALFGRLPHELDRLELSLSHGDAPIASPVRVGATTLTSVTVPFPPVPLDSAHTAAAQANVTDGTSATVNWVAAEGYTSPCSSPVSLSYDANVPGFSCGNGAVNASYWTTVPTRKYGNQKIEVSSALDFFTDVNWYGVGMVWMSVAYTPAGSGQFVRKTPIALWGPGVVPA